MALKIANPVGNHMFKVNNRNTGTRCNSEHILHLVLMFLLTLSRSGRSNQVPLNSDFIWNILPLFLCVSKHHGKDFSFKYSYFLFKMPLLGVFQKLIASRANDHEGFYLLSSMIQHMPWQSLEAQMSQVFILLFQRLKGSKTTKFVKGEEFL